MTNFTFTLDGKVVTPVDWDKVQVMATYINTSQTGELTESVQPNIDVSAFTFVNEAAKQIRDYITNGLTTGVGIFEGMPFNVIASDGVNTITVFDGFLDLTDGYKEIHTAKVEAKMKDLTGLNSLNDRAKGVSYGFLLDKGFLVSSDFTDIEYVVERKHNPIELIMAAIAIYLMTKELIEAVEKLAKNVANVISIATGGGVIVGVVSSLILAITYTIIQAIYTAIIIVAIIKMVGDLIDKLVPRVRKHKGIKFRTLLERGASYLGYTLNSNISEIDTTYYLPSKPDEDTPVLDGIPKASDFGYTVEEAFILAKRCFNGKIQVENNRSKLQLHSENDAYWLKTSTYQQPSVLVEERNYNASEMKSQRLIEFETDLKDDWTANNYTGTTYAISTTPITENSRDMVMMKDLDIVNIPVALPSRKDELNEIEKVLKVLAGAADLVVKTFGGRSNLVKKITGKVGMLKLSHNVHGVPKLVPLNSALRMPVNHRDLWSAKLLYNKYHNERSFVANNYGQQYELFNDIVVPFGLSEFISLINNGYFTTFDGRTGKAGSLRWTLGETKSVMDYRIKSIYTKNLKETFVEA